MGIKQGIGHDVIFQEDFIDFVFVCHRSADQCMHGDLVDHPGQTLGKVEDGLDGLFGEQLCGSFSAFKMKVHIGDGIVKGALIAK